MSGEFKVKHSSENREQESQEQIEKIDITGLVDDIYQGILKYWVVLLAILSICSSGMYFYQKSSYVPNYNAYSTFVVDANTTVSYSYDYYNKTTASQLANTFPYIIENSVMQHIIAEELGTGYVPGKISAKAMSGTNMITISVDASDGQTAYDILQAVIKNYPKVATSVIGNTDLNILDESGVPYQPTNPFSAKRAGRRGFLLGLILCAAGLILYSLTKKTIRRESDFQNLLNIKCLGVIPNVKFKKRTSVDKNLVLINSRRVNYSFVEANRTIRTRIEREAAEKKFKVYMVSSAIAGEGKSTVAANLALSLADKGRRVILVDMDLRNPSVNKTFGIPVGEHGLVDYLRGEVRLNEVVKKYKDTELYYIPGGKPVRSATSLLREEVLATMLGKLRELADFVIVDTPPSSMFTDAAIIAKNADAGVFVVKQDYAPTERILEGIEILTESGLQITGCILNCAEYSLTEYGSGSYYGHYRYGGSYSKYSRRPVEK